MVARAATAGGERRLDLWKGVVRAEEGAIRRAAAISLFVRASNNQTIVPATMR